MKEKEHHNHIYGQCKRHMHAYVLVELTNGTTVDGIITGLDDENVYFAIPERNEGNMENMQRHPQAQRPFGGGYGHHGPGYGYGGPGYGHGPGYGYQSPFTRLILPLTAIAALTLLPWY